jgi:hypothetical protein
MVSCNVCLALAGMANMDDTPAIFFTWRTNAIASSS